MIRIARLAFTSAAGSLLLVGAFSPVAGASKSSKATFFLTGIAINGVNFMPGSKVTEKSNNACYFMLGAAGTPNSLTAIAIFDAHGVPASASASVKLVTPFQTVSGTGRFSKVIFLAKHLWSGVVPAGNYYRFANRQGGSIQAVDGKYVVSATATVGGHKLSAHGSISVAC